MVVKISLEGIEQKTPMESKLVIQTGDEFRHSVGMKFGFDSLWSYSEDSSSTAFDFLLLAQIVYCVDRSVSRLKFSDDGWHRNLHVDKIPIQNAEVFQKAKPVLEGAINFLTGDEWHLNFIQVPILSWRPKKITAFDRNGYTKVSLFSGGLDSLIGFIDEASALGENEKILLISHKELGKEGGDQKRILDICASQGFFEGKYSQLQLNAGIKSNTWENRLPSEGTFRARSLLFFAAGIYAAHAISAFTPLIVPENGTISLNIPLDKGRRGACSTRTTHPTFIKRIQEALSLVGIENPIINPYQLKSKADMMIDAFQDENKKRILTKLAHVSCSCAKRSHNRWWDKRGGIVRHCGYCLPCIYRRVSLDAVGLDSMDYIGTDPWDSERFDIRNHAQARSSDIRSLLYFLKNNFNTKYIERELLINGIRDTKEIAAYMEMLMQSYQQVNNWINKVKHD